MIVDTHLHVWSSDYDTYPMEGGRTSSEDGSVEFLNTKMAEAGVGKAVIVQPIHYLFDNTYVGDTLKRFPGKFAAIGLVNQFEPGAADRLETLVTEHGFSGLRIHLSRPDHTSMWAGSGPGRHLGQGRQARARASSRTDRPPSTRTSSRSSRGIPTCPSHSTTTAARPGSRTRRTPA